MCAAAIEQSPWLMVDPYETSVRNAKGEPAYMPTAQVLAHIDHEINDVLGGVGGQRARVCLLAGSDLVSRKHSSWCKRQDAMIFTNLKIQTMSTPNLWSPADLDIILGTYGCFVIERSG
jgi:nicotinamide mononucleotide adenylyltransferase